MRHGHLQLLLPVLLLEPAACMTRRATRLRLAQCSFSADVITDSWCRLGYERRLARCAGSKVIRAAMINSQRMGWEQAISGEPGQLTLERERLTETPHEKLQ